MTRKIILGLLLALGSFWPTPFGGTASLNAQAAQLSPQSLVGIMALARADRIIVKPVAGVNLSALHLILGTQTVRTFPAIGNLQIIQLPPLLSAHDAIAFYRTSGLVAYAEQDFFVHLLATPNDPGFANGSLWALHNTGQLGGVNDADIDAPEAWEFQTSANNIIIALTDTGIRTTHEDLAPNLWVNPGEIPGNGIDDDGNGFVDDVHGANFVTGTGDPTDDHGHGTHLSGLTGAAGDNALGIAGVAWQVKLMACKFLDSAGNGTISDAIAAIDYARAKGAHIINASWGNTSFTSQALFDSIASARDAGILFVAAAGNAGADNDASPLLPASYDLDNIIAVTATDRQDILTFFGNFGATTVDLAAPGHEIFSSWHSSDNAYQSFSGSSMAAGFVSGTAALLKAHFPGENYTATKQRILSTTDPLPTLQGKCVSGGRLNLANALSDGQPPPPTATVTATATDANASEAGDTGTFAINRTGSTDAALTVNYSLSGTAGNGADYQTLPASVTIPAGSASAVITVTPINDTTVEGDETVVLTLAAGSGYTIGSPDSATVTIADNDSVAPTEPVVTLSQFDPDASETGSDIGVVRFHRTGDISQPLDVSWTFSGTAANGSDYQQLPTSGAFLAGQAEADLPITPIDDSEVEGEETVIVTLVDGPGYAVGSANTATVTIADNDTAPPTEPVVTLSLVDADASETGSDIGVVRFHRTGDISQPLDVSWTFSGSASNGADYQQLPTSGAFLAGQAEADLPITPIDDSEVEGEETVIVTLVDGPGYAVGSANSATVTIADNDTAPPTEPVVTLSLVDANASETGSDIGVVRFHRTGDISQPLDVSWTFSGSASNGADYQQLPTSGAFLAGQAEADLPITPIDDSEVEGEETVIVTLVDGPGYAVGSANSATVTIADNDTAPPTEPVVTLSLVDANASETGPDGGVVRFHRTGDISQPLDVSWTFSGSASNGADYQQLPTSGAFLVGQAEADLPITPVDDSEVEGEETVIVTLVDGPGYAVGSANSATVTIADNDTAPPPTPTITVVASDAAAAEAGANTGTFTVSRSGSTTASLTVNYTLSGTASNGSDYQSLGTSVTIPAGASSANVTVTPINDTAVEGNETVVLTLASGTGYNIGSPSGATVNIADNDTAPPPTPTVTVVASDSAAAEAGANTGTFTVSRSGSTSASLTVNYTVGGSASNGSDYQSLPNFVTIPAGAASANVTVTPIDDSAVEGNETVVLTLASGTGYNIGSPNSATVNIADNDTAPPPTPVVTVVASDSAAAEAGANTGTFTISRSGSTSASLTVNYTLGGSASNGTDYQSLGNSVTIPAGATSANVTVTPIDDTAVEGNETVVLTLASGTGYNTGSPSSATVTIADNDSAPPPPRPTVTVIASDLVAGEAGPNPGEFTISRTGSTATALTVRYTMGGTATNGADYQALPGSAIIPAGSSNVRVRLTPIDDRAIEVAELAVLSLAPDAAYLIGIPSLATITIADNDLLLLSR
ncbi:MAG: Calx-beta domain-containing protein [Verrucomicrobiota bacterium]